MAYKVYPVKGFVLSGWLFIGPFWIWSKFDGDFRPHFKSTKIPDILIKPVYLWLEFWRKRNVRKIDSRKTKNNRAQG